MFLKAEERIDVSMLQGEYSRYRWKNNDVVLNSLSYLVCIVLWNIVL